MRLVNHRLLPAACCLLLFVGCGSPNAANITLRKENQKLQTQVADLNRQHDSDRATIQTYETKNGILPSLTQDKLDKLVITQGISLGRLTGGHNTAAEKYDDGISVYVTPIDSVGDPLKAAGTFKVETFDLDQPNHPLIGTWNFDLDQTRKLYYAQLSLHTYLLPCPWISTPAHPDLTVKVTFTDELTGRVFTAQKELKVNPPPTTAPVSY